MYCRDRHAPIDIGTRDDVVNDHMTYRMVAIGGTFDRLHSGHRFFLARAFEISERVVVGLTSDTYVMQRKAESGKGKAVLLFVQREKDLREFFGEMGWLDRVEIVKIEDVYGPVVTRADIEAIVVTSHSRPGAQIINNKRHQAGLHILEIIEVPLQHAQDHRTISSTRIRMGEIDRWGHVLSKLDIFGKPISSALRLALKEPQGELIRGSREDLHLVVPRLKEIIRETKPTMIITVGDEVTKLANDLSLAQVLSIIDFKVERNPKYTTFEELGVLPTSLRGTQRRSLQAQAGNPDRDKKSSVTRSINLDGNIQLVSVRNTAGIISKTLVGAIKRAIKRNFVEETRSIIRVIGEDDLAGVPAIILAPLGSLVIYGQPGVGIVVVLVTEEKKQEISRLFDP